MRYQKLSWLTVHHVNHINRCDSNLICPAFRIIHVLIVSLLHVSFSIKKYARRCQCVLVRSSSFGDSKFQ